MQRLEPFLVERIAMPKVWGGWHLSQLLGIELPAGEAIGETWELYDRVEGSSRLRGSARTLDQLMQDPDALVGKGVPLGHGGRFPLLLKFLDAREQLSLQVHPDDVGARKRGDSGKNECCVVLQAGPSARITRGLRPGVTVDELSAKAGTPAIEGLVHSFRPQVGDTIHFPPGTIHAIGPDVVVFEVQQNSDLTYRLYDWGRGRQLHVQEALESTRTSNAADDPQAVPPTTLADGGIQLITTNDFRVRRYWVRQPMTMSTHGRFFSITTLRGRGELLWPGLRARGRLVLAAGDTVLVPASIDNVELVPSDFLNVLVCDPGNC